MAKSATKKKTAPPEAQDSDALAETLHDLLDCIEDLADRIRVLELCVSALALAEQKATKARKK